MSSGGSERVAEFEARHAAIITRTLAWADESAARGEYAQAVHWVQTVRGMGHGLPAEYETRLEMWRNAIDPDPRLRG